MGKVARSLALLGLTATLLACAGASKQDTGTLLGGLLGGIIGHQVDDGGSAGILLGTLAGAALGRMIGYQMDEADRRKLAETLNEADSGETRRWRNEESGNEYVITPTSAVHDEGGKQCRNFKQEVIIDGRPEVIDATACRSSDEAPWQISA
ncbi:hypothetical protein GCM10011348_15000 [Marinobacterium nitratireducens]|uniref:Glycine zipper 2TM domain-containing protein n=1 Tax=Marinobacterium nitratireducens TaxID=518897 RepID=A0A917ZB11_9GAMM|nr:glycine zipper 2TM domain-containing protein [Marinobacterium nitratireducens]GGO79795.1 hypothetical protein GCM10011348_15000 [Marinobacterium nitratireducens]